VEAEHFDLGGEGKAYHDMDRANIAGAYRPDEGVDIYDRLGEGYHIGNALPGEWIEYTVEVQEEADYLMEVYLAAMESGGCFMVRIGDAWSDTLESISSGSWLATAPVSEILHLHPGIQVMRFSVMERPLFNFDKIVFSTPGAAWNQVQGDLGLYVHVTFNRQLEIRAGGSTGERMIRIFDLHGRVIHTDVQTGPGARFLSDQLPPGLYIIQVAEGRKIWSRKVVVQ
jgi:hypothetical protein